MKVAAQASLFESLSKGKEMFKLDDEIKRERATAYWQHRYQEYKPSSHNQEMGER